MNLTGVIEDLRREAQRIGDAISLLERIGGGKRRGRPPGSRNKRGKKVVARVEKVVSRVKSPKPKRTRKPKRIKAEAVAA
jgi:hypothetical protein